MKLMCECGNIEELKTEEGIDNFKTRNCGDGTVVLICKKCSSVVFLKGVRYGT